MMMHSLRSTVDFFRKQHGTTAVEFAFVAPVLFILTIGTIDVGRMVWSASMLHHVAREATRFASIRGADSASPASANDVQSFVNDQLIGVLPNEVTVTTNWTPNNNTGGTVQVQLDYQYTFFVGGLIGLDPLPLQGDSQMIVL